MKEVSGSRFGLRRARTKEVELTPEYPYKSGVAGDGPCKGNRGVMMQRRRQRRSRPQLAAAAEGGFGGWSGNLVTKSAPGGEVSTLNVQGCKVANAVPVLAAQLGILDIRFDDRS